MKITVYHLWMGYLWSSPAINGFVAPGSAGLCREGLFRGGVTLFKGNQWEPKVNQLWIKQEIMNISKYFNIIIYIYIIWISHIEVQNIFNTVHWHHRFHTVAKKLPAYHQRIWGATGPGGVGKHKRSVHVAHTTDPLWCFICASKHDFLRLWRGFCRFCGFL